MPVATPSGPVVPGSVSAINFCPLCTMPDGMHESRGGAFRRARRRVILSMADHGRRSSLRGRLRRGSTIALDGRWSLRLPFKMPESWQAATVDSDGEGVEFAIKLSVPMRHVPLSDCVMVRVSTAGVLSVL